MKKLLITGVSGLLGSNVAYYLREKYDILGLYHDHPVSIDGIRTMGLDLLSEKQVSEIVHSFDPDYVLHCASLTNVDFCEANQEEARRVNVGGTRIVVDSLESNSRAKLIYVSSDLVYGGKHPNSQEDDPIDPVNFYGTTKLEGERESLKRENSLILRTNIFGWNIQNKRSLSEWVIDELIQGHEIQGFNDVLFSSIYTFDFAKLLSMAIEKDLKGVFNLGSSTYLSKYDFGMKLAELFGLDKNLIQSISVEQSKLKAKRAKNISLNTSKLAQALSVQPPTLPESLTHFHEDHKKGVLKEIKNGKNTGPYYPKNIDIPYGKQSLDDRDIEAVVNVLKNSNLTQGGKVFEFEEALCRVTGAKYAVAVSSGTAALHIACLVAGVGVGDEIMTSTNTFVASANAAVYCQGKPILCDIDPKTYNVSLDSLDKKISEKTLAVIPVHFAGQSCMMSDIQERVKAKEKQTNKKIYIIEDASHALGSYYKGTSIGSCAYSDMAVTSFHPVKHITTGEGGAVFTNDEETYRKLKLFRSHGITNDSKWLLNDDMAYSHSKDGSGSLQNPWYYEQSVLGYNYRITDIQCALGTSQLEKLEKFRARRQQIVATYNKAFSEYSSVTLPFQNPDSNANFHLYVLKIDFERIGMPRVRLMKSLRDAGIITQVHYIPVHLQPYYRENFGTRYGDCPNAEKYYEQCLSIPLFGAMTEDMVEKVIKELSCHLKS